MQGYDVTPESAQLPATMNSAQSSLQPHQNESLVKAVTKTRDRMLLAREYGRDEDKSIARILKTCARASFAEIAIYEKPQGSGVIKGPSVRLAEEIARQWGNFDTGFKIIKQDDEGTLAEVFAWDLETNSQKADEVYISHRRYTKSSGLQLEKRPDEIYKMVGAQVSKSIRNVILKVIPRDVTEMAFEACEQTLLRVTDLKPVIGKLVTAWAGFGVTPVQLEKVVGKKIEDLLQADLAKLRAAFIAIKDGEMTVAEFLSTAAPEAPPAEPVKTKAKKGAATVDVVAEPVADPKLPDTGASGSKQSSSQTAQDPAAVSEVSKDTNPKPDADAVVKSESSAPQQPAAASDSAPGVKQAEALAVGDMF